MQAGYSHEIWNGGPDLRLGATGYEFNAGDSVYGWNAQAELKSRDGMFVLRYNVGNDRINKTYQMIGGFVNVGFRPENLLSGQSPFTMPEPIFKSPRNLWYMLTQTVKRNWHQPSAALISQQGQQGQQGGTCQLGTYRYSGTIHDQVLFATDPLTPSYEPWEFPAAVVLRWCGLKSDTSMQELWVYGTYDFFDGQAAGRYADPSGAVILSAPSGSLVLSNQQSSYIGGSDITQTVKYLINPDMEFDTGGGISLDFQ